MDKGNPKTEEINPHPHTDKAHKNPNLVHTNIEANEQERPVKSTSRQLREAQIIDTLPESRSPENSDPETKILEREETHKSPHAHPNNTQITIIGGQKPFTLGTTAQSVHTPTIITINSSEDGLDDSMKK